MKVDALSASVTEFIKRRLSSKEQQVFLFGSVLYKPQFRDVDIGVLGSVDPRQLALLREDFEESNFPYLVDIVDFNQVSPSFKNKVMAKQVLWLNF